MTDSSSSGDIDNLVVGDLVFVSVARRGMSTTVGPMLYDLDEVAKLGDKTTTGQPSLWGKSQIPPYQNGMWIFDHQALVGEVVGKKEFVFDRLEADIRVELVEFKVLTPAGFIYLSPTYSSVKDLFIAKCTPELCERLAQEATFNADTGYWTWNSVKKRW